MINYLKKYNILLILIVILLARIMYSLYYGEKESIFSDAEGYSRIAININTNSNWILDKNTFEFREPIFPLYVALVYFLFGIKNYLAVYVVNSAISVFLCYLIFRLAYKIFGKMVAYISLCWSGLYVFYYFYSGDLLREVIVFFLLFSFFYQLYIYLMENDGIKKLIFCSLIFSILVLTDARYLFYIPFLLLLFLIYSPKLRNIKRYMYFSLLVFVFIFPWNLRNYVVYGDIVFINTRTYDNRLKDNIRTRLLSTEKITKPKSYETADYWEVNYSYPLQQERDSVINGYNPRHRSDVEVALIKKNIYADSTFLGRKLYWMKEMFRPVRLHYDYLPFPSAAIEKPWSFKHNITSGLFYGLLIPLFFISCVLLIKCNKKEFFFLIFPIITQGLLHFLMFGLDRYRLPIDSFIIILSAYALFEIIKRFKRKTNLNDIS
jgi:4-amino-4-deoxy-L-arabinose transferase-like glycosyltransferase